jgi:ribosomal protein S12 methylthiotransferase accessory factor
MCFTNGKGATKESALCSALGEFIERLSCNFFYNDQFFGEEIANSAFVHYPNERGSSRARKTRCPRAFSTHTREIYDPDGELRGLAPVRHQFRQYRARHLSLPFVRQSDGEVVYFPTNLIENLYLSNGMSAGNTLHEAQVQCLSEIFERAVKREILEGKWPCPMCRRRCWQIPRRFWPAFEALEAQGFPVLVKDASLGGRSR